MNVFIKDKESNIFYKLFNVSSIKVSIYKFSDDEDVVDVQIYNDNLHICGYCIFKREEAKIRYQKLSNNIKTKEILFFIFDSVSEK